MDQSFPDNPGAAWSFRGTRRPGSILFALAALASFSIITLILAALCLVVGRFGLALYVMQLVLSLFLVGFAVLAMIRYHQWVQAAQKVSPKTMEPHHKQYGYAMALLRITRFLGSSASVQETLDGVTQVALDLFEAEQTSVLLFNETTRDLEVRSTAGLLESSVVGQRQTLGEGIAGQVAVSGEPVLMGIEVDRIRFPKARKNAYNISASMVVPIRLREELVGVLCVGRRTPGRSYDTEDLDIVQVFAEVVAVYIRRTQQATWMRETIHRLEGLVPSNRKAA
jgi:transcriptional regulator with GAF, ATPase, and Fis domain